MKKYILSVGLGVVVGIVVLSASSCVEKKSAVAEFADAGLQTEGTMTVGTPTITVNPQITDSVTQSLPQETK